MLAGNEEDLLWFGAHQHLVQRVEFGGLRGVAEVAGVNDEVGLLRQGVDLVDGGLQGGGDIGVRGLAEAHVAVADLDEVEFSLRGMLPALAEGLRREDAAAHGPEDSGSGPGHAFQEAAAVDAVVIVVVNDSFCHVHLACPDSDARQFIPSGFCGIFVAVRWSTLKGDWKVTLLCDELRNDP